MGKGPAMITSLAKVENGKDAWRAAAWTHRQYRWMMNLAGFGKNGWGDLLPPAFRRSQVVSKAISHFFCYQRRRFEITKIYWGETGCHYESWLASSWDRSGASIRCQWDSAPVILQLPIWHSLLINAPCLITWSFQTPCHKSRWGERFEPMNNVIAGGLTLLPETSL
jgi:hypothetical protein